VGTSPPRAALPPARGGFPFPRPGPAAAAAAAAAGATTTTGDGSSSGSSGGGTGSGRDEAENAVHRLSRHLRCLRDAALAAAPADAVAAALAPTLHLAPRLLLRCVRLLLDHAHRAATATAVADADADADGRGERDRDRSGTLFFPSGLGSSLAAGLGGVGVGVGVGWRTFTGDSGGGGDSAAAAAAARARARTRASTLGESTTGAGAGMVDMAPEDRACLLRCVGACQQVSSPALCPLLPSRLSYHSPPRPPFPITSHPVPLPLPLPLRRAWRHSSRCPWTRPRPWPPTQTSRWTPPASAASQTRSQTRCRGRLAWSPLCPLLFLPPLSLSLSPCLPVKTPACLCPPLCSYYLS